jgi:hypothetical protein
VRFHPAVRALSARVVRRPPEHKAIAIGHARRKLVHLAFAVWKSRKPFDPPHDPWETPAHRDGAAGSREPDTASSGPERATDLARSAEDQAAGHHPETTPESSVVTAAQAEPFVDCAHRKQQLSRQRVLEQLGLAARLRDPGLPQRGPCPLHRGDGRGRSVSVPLGDKVFPGFERAGGPKGDVIDLWARVKGMSLRAAALDLVQTVNLEPAPRPGTEKRNG